MKSGIPVILALSLFTGGLATGVALSSPPAPAAPAPPRAVAVQEMPTPPQAAFNQALYGSEGRRGMIEAVRIRILELALLGDKTSAEYDEELFFLGFMKLFQEMGSVIPGRNKGVQIIGSFEILLDSLEGDEWLLHVPGRASIAQHPLRHLTDEDLIVPKGRFVKYVTRDGIWSAGAIDPAGFEHYALWIGMDEHSVILYPNQGRDDRQPWAAWVPGRDVSTDWKRPKLVESAGHPRR